MGNQSNSKDYFIYKDLKEIKKLPLQTDTFLWVDANIQNSENKDKLKKLIANGINPTLFASIEELVSITKKVDNKKYRIICSTKLGQELCRLVQNNEKVIHIYLFCDYKKRGEQLIEKYSNKVRFYALNIQQFLVKIHEQFRYDKKYFMMPQFRQITSKINVQEPNIPYLNNLRYTLYGLLLFKDRAEAKKDFIKLIKYLFPEQNYREELELFQKEFPQKRDCKAVLSWYNKQTFYYGFLNNFLNFTNDPLQIVYLRFTFESTFKSIREIYRQGNQQKELTLYRGGKLTEQQLSYFQKNVGEYFQIYGFMSAAYERSEAEKFYRNSLIIIQVEDEDRESDIDNGYIQISDTTAYSKEMQVLFNALNIFKIISFQKVKNTNIITIKYGQLARIIKQQPNQLSKKEKNIVVNYKSQHQIIEEKIKNQGDVLYYCQMYHEATQYRESQLKLKGETQQSIQLSNRLYKLGESQRQKGHYDKTLEYFEKALKIQLTVLGENHTQTANTFNNIGLVYKIKKQYNLALRCYERALKIYLNIIGDNHASTATTYINIGSVYEVKKDYNKALQNYQKALKIRLNLFGDNHISTASIINSIGLIHKAKGEYDKSLEYQQKTLKIRLNILGDNHISTANTYHNVGSLLDSKGQHTKALQQYEKALNIYLNIYGEQNVATATMINNIGLAYEGNKQFQKALEYFQRALKIRLNLLGQNHSQSANTYNNIGSVYKSKGQLKIALQYYQKAFKIRLQNDGESVSTAHTMNNMALVYDEQGDFNKAEQFYLKSLQIRLDILGQNHFEIANSFNNLGLIYKTKKEYKKAIEYYEKALKIYLNLFGNNHNSTATTFNNIASVYHIKGQYNKALEFYEKALEIRLNIFGENHVSTANTFHNLGAVYDAKGQYNKALEEYEKSLQIRLKVIGENHIQTANLMNNIGFIYKTKGDYEKALNNYERTLQIQLNLVGQIHLSTATTYNNIASVYQTNGQYGKASENFKKSYNIRLKLLGEDHESTINSLKFMKQCQKRLKKK